jgi:hypothetical protein
MLSHAPLDYAPVSVLEWEWPPLAKLSFSLKSLGASDKEVLRQRCENEDNSQ